MDIRKSAVHLSPDERDRFLEALIRLKQRPAPNGPAGLSRYDQFVALHRAVMTVLPPGTPAGETVNFGHWNIGFCPWHRKYLRELEKALQAEVAGVTIPYWDWTAHDAALSILFTHDFLGSLPSESPGPLTDSVLRNPVPTDQRPAWWPPGADGYPIHPLLQEEFGSTLARGSVGEGWPPLAAAIDQLERLVVVQPDAHPLWFFWTVLEQGQANITARTHNTGHRFIGGHMSGAFSPNDPIFWLHHANVDRLWANWQAGRLRDVPGSKPEDHYPPPDQLSPLDGDLAPPGHRLDDAMWPWVGGAAGFDVDIDPALRALLPDFSSAPTVTVRDVLDTETIDDEGYRYAAPRQAGPSLPAARSVAMSERPSADLNRVSFVGGKATYGSRPPDPAVLEVETTWRCPTPGYELELELELVAPPLLPTAIALGLVVTPPSGLVPDVLTDVTARYSEQTDTEYKEVLIHPDGPTLPVEPLG